VLEFDTNVLAFMTAALEQTCKKLKVDTPEARKHVADRLIECAKSGRKSMLHLMEAGEEALAELDKNVTQSPPSWWRKVIGIQ
jgi:urease gamma subunit